MRVGDLVKNLNSESGVLGIIVGWKALEAEFGGQRNPIVQWADGRCSWIGIHRIEVISESR